VDDLDLQQLRHHLDPDRGRAARFNHHDDHRHLSHRHFPLPLWRGRGAGGDDPDLPVGAVGSLPGDAAAADEERTREMINRYRWWEYLLIYAGMALFLVFMLAPFVEAFMVSLRPLNEVFRVPYRFIAEGMGF